MKETIVFTVGIIVVVTVGILLFRKKPKEAEVPIENLRSTLDRAKAALASANAELERFKDDTSLDYNPGLKQVALTTRLSMRDIMQNVYDGALKAVQDRESKQK